eukprot:2048428-Pyramimonas_sp.AAC.1
MAPQLFYNAIVKKLPKNNDTADQSPGSASDHQQQGMRQDIEPLTIAPLQNMLGIQLDSFGTSCNNGAASANTANRPRAAPDALVLITADSNAFANADALQSLLQVHWPCLKVWP